MPIADFKKPEHLEQLDAWLRSYRHEELFDAEGTLLPELAALAPSGKAPHGCNPHANGGELLVPLSLPSFRDHAVAVGAPGVVKAEATRNLGLYLRALMRLNAEKKNFRLFGPDETASNRLEGGL